MTLAKAVKHRVHSIASRGCVHQSTLLPSQKRIAEFVAQDLHPISVVDGQGFTRLLNYLEPGYKVPSRPHVTSICHKMFDSLN